MSNFENASDTSINNNKIKTPKVPKEPKVKAPKEPKYKESKIKKDPKEPNGNVNVKVKVQKEPKEPKVNKDIKELKIKEVKAPKEPKAKAPKANGISSANANTTVEFTNIVLKKRGRKPKGGKIISSTTVPCTNTNVGFGTTHSDTAAYAHMVPKKPFVSANVILHLKCNYSDLLVNSSMSSFKYEPVVEDVESYTNFGDISETAGTFLGAFAGIYSDDVNSIIDNDGADCNVGNIDCEYHDGGHTQHTIKHHNLSTTVPACMFQPTPALTTTSSVQQSAISCVPLKSPYVISSTITTTSSTDANNNSAHSADTDIEMKEVWRKINRLKMVLHKDNVRFNSTQQSGCFWCTCEFDTPVIYIPKLYTKSTDSYTVYGCFCSPECATSYLMKETIDTSTRFERYQMLNVIYNNICNNTDNPIKPAPDPHYLLSKFYGNLSIEEYRKLLKSDHLLYIVNKPLTHSLPELYEDNNEFLVNNKTTIPNAMSKTKKR